MFASGIVHGHKTYSKKASSLTFVPRTGPMEFCLGNYDSSTTFSSQATNWISVPLNDGSVILNT